MTALEPLKFRRILVPVDESHPSQNSLAVAAGLARETDAEVILAHVVQMRWSQDEAELKATYGQIIDDYRQSGEETLRRTAGSEVFSGLDVDTQLVFGNNPAGELLRLAMEGGWTPSSWAATGAGVRTDDPGFGELARHPRRHGARDHRPAAPGAGERGQRIRDQITTSGKKILYTGYLLTA